ncbi:hypothetical protein DUNSADRAFT_16258 [Dunaliella salina]|uniref:Encoded protein n=1 Tax=Dunaliella salina TaxID=3046 RepID=A0ABQ7H164_DUNSA|nr:hypothetical protein DUNSADRAFT_16258 [Dunaliella salina]|eukprot:KAF5840595.1 hypothetical protein DUNSADRAFT_16258 [Dunaliella salina]
MALPSTTAPPHVLCCKAQQTKQSMRYVRRCLAAQSLLTKCCTECLKTLSQTQALRSTFDLKKTWKPAVLKRCHESQSSLKVSSQAQNFSLKFRA